MADNDITGYISFKLTLGSQIFESSGPVASINVSTEAYKIPTAVITFVDGDPALQDFETSSESYLNPGTEVTIDMGYKGVNKTVFSGTIVKHAVKVRGSSSITMIECKHDAVKMTLGRRNAVYEKTDDQISDKDIITELFTNHGLSSKVTCASESTAFMSHDTIVQFDCTDWDFFITRAEANSKLVYFDGSVFQVQDPEIESGATATRTFNYGKEIFEIESEVDARTQLKKVEAHSWDVASQAKISSVAAASGFSQLEGANSGITASDLEGVTSPTSFELFHGGYVPSTELAGWGKARLTKASLGKVRGSIKVYGDNGISLGDIIEVKGMGTKFSGLLMVTGLRHEFTDAGWYTHVQFGVNPDWFIERYSIRAPAAGGLVSGVNGLQIGKVVAIYQDSADAQHRIEVKLPVIGDDKTFMARMLFDEAGSDRGVCFWPEADDEVVVGFLNEDPRHPVILGSLYSSTNSPPVTPAEDNNVRQIKSRTGITVTFNDNADEDTSLEIKTPGGQKVLLDDTNEKLVLEDQHGNTITMESGGVTVKSDGDITLDAGGKVSLKAGGDVELDGVNLKNTASAKYSVSGSGGVAIESSAISEIKGSMVKIN